MKINPVLGQDIPLLTIFLELKIVFIDFVLSKKKHFAFIDFKKAFHTVWRSALWSKLKIFTIILNHLLWPILHIILMLDNVKTSIYIFFI